MELIKLEASGILISELQVQLIYYCIENANIAHLLSVGRALRRDSYCMFEAAYDIIDGTCFNSA